MLSDLKRHVFGNLRMHKYLYDMDNTNLDA